MRYNGSKGDEALKEREREGRRVLCASRGWKYEPVRKCGEEGRIFSPASGRNDLPTNLPLLAVSLNTPLKRICHFDRVQSISVYQSFSKKEFICNGAHWPFFVPLNQNYAACHASDCSSSGLLGAKD